MADAIDAGNVSVVAAIKKKYEHYGPNVNKNTAVKDIHVLIEIIEQQHEDIVQLVSEWES